MPYSLRVIERGADSIVSFHDPGPKAEARRRARELAVARQTYPGATVKAGSPDARLAARPGVVVATVSVERVG